MKSATEIAHDIRSGKVRAYDLMEQTLAKIKRSNASVNAFVFIDERQALEQAAQIDHQVADGSDPGPFAGVPIGVKDNEACFGMPTRFGSLLHSDAKKETNDSVHVQRLRDAGAIPVGKVATAEFGLDGVTYTHAHGVTRNPWNLQKTPGGSSGGSSAAVSAGMVPFCTGSDALGSIRCPASFTGLLGLKPSHGRIPREHGFKETASVGALTTTVKDMARYLDIVSGPSDMDHMTLPASATNYEQQIDELDVTGLRASWSPDLGFAPVTGEVSEICEQAAFELIASAKLELNPETFVCTNVYHEWNALASLLIKGEFERQGILSDHMDKISPGPRRFIQGSQSLSAAEQVNYREQLVKLEKEVAEFFRTNDILITPVTCCEAYSAEGPMPTVIEGRDASRTHAEPYTAIGSVCWNPSISIPVGCTASGLPVGLLLTGPRHRDEILLRLARIWEQIRPWPRTAPSYEDDL